MATTPPESLIARAQRAYEAFTDKACNPAERRAFVAGFVVAGVAGPETVKEAYERGRTDIPPLQREIWRLRRVNDELGPPQRPAAAPVGRGHAIRPLCVMCDDAEATHLLDGDPMCTACLPECEQCHDPATHEDLESGAWYCEDCATEPETCAHCNGSGEGMHDGTRCRTCGGSGCGPTPDPREVRPVVLVPIGEAAG